MLSAVGSNVWAVASWMGCGLFRAPYLMPRANTLRHDRSYQHELELARFRTRGAWPADAQLTGRAQAVFGNRAFSTFQAARTPFAHDDKSLETALDGCYLVGGMHLAGSTWVKCSSSHSSGAGPKV